MYSHLKNWDGRYFISHYDKPTDSWIYIAIHSNDLGPATGGTRMRVYEQPELAVKDALILSESMTLKYSVAQFPRGGGKVVINPPAGLSIKDRAGLLRRYGTIIKDLGGLFYTGPDVGTGIADMELINEHGAPYVFGTKISNATTLDAGRASAYGVLTGMKSTWNYLTSSTSLRGVRILIEGVGNLGRNLIELLLEEKAEIYYTDIDENKGSAYRESKYCSFLPQEVAFLGEYDMYAPCALGGSLNYDTVGLLKCRAIVGGANNQLEHPDVANILKNMGILYAPDFAVNSGAAIGVTGQETYNWNIREAETEIAKIGETLLKIYNKAEREAISTHEAALKMSMEVIVLQESKTY